MRGVASPAGRQVLPKSLMERLALQAAGRLPVPAHRIQNARRAPPRLIIFASFGVGVLASGVIGGIAFFGLQTLAISDRRADAERSIQASTLAEAPPATSWHRRQVFDVAIPRGERTHTPLRLRVAGGDADSIEIIMHGFPVAAKLSQGERRGAVTWVLRPADLDDLHLSLSDTAPDAFDVRIDVLAPPGVPTVGSTARVRVVDTSSQETRTATVAEGAPIDRQGEAVAVATNVIKSRSAQFANTVPASTLTDEEKAERQRGEGPSVPQRAAPTVQATMAAPQPGSPSRPWPEGASALGAISRDSGRQVWWTVPPPSWSPFQESSGTP
jgi:hypothetical protein